MSTSSPEVPAPPGRRGIVAFLLTQLGTHAAGRFGERVAELDLTPPMTGVLRLIAHEPGRSQQSLAAVLGVLPSKVVALVDDLEYRGLIERRRNPRDRRLHALHLTEAGRTTTARLRQVAETHEAEVLAPLDADEREQLGRLLSRLADAHGLQPGVHPGYRRLPDDPRPAGAADHHEPVE